MLGSNSRPGHNIKIAGKRLKNLFSAIAFSSIRVSDAFLDPELSESDIITIQNTTFTNQAVLIETDDDYDTLRSKLKQLEKEMGRTDSKTIIPIDIDIMQYGEQKFKLEDWTRDYTITLISELYC